MMGIALWDAHRVKPTLGMRCVITITSTLHCFPVSLAGGHTSLLWPTGLCRVALVGMSSHHLCNMVSPKWRVDYTMCVTVTFSNWLPTEWCTVPVCYAYLNINQSLIILICGHVRHSLGLVTHTVTISGVQSC